MKNKTEIPAIYRNIQAKLLKKYPLLNHVTHRDLKYFLGTSFKLKKTQQGIVIRELLEMGLIKRIPFHMYQVQKTDPEHFILVKHSKKDKDKTKLKETLNKNGMF